MMASVPPAMGGGAASASTSGSEYVPTSTPPSAVLGTPGPPPAKPPDPVLGGELGPNGIESGGELGPQPAANVTTTVAPKIPTSFICSPPPSRPRRPRLVETTIGFARPTGFVL